MKRWKVIFCGGDAGLVKADFEKFRQARTDLKLIPGSVRDETPAEVVETRNSDGLKPDDPGFAVTSATGDKVHVRVAHFVEKDDPESARDT